jgi:lysophospholipase L1-like esterase
VAVVFCVGINDAWSVVMSDEQEFARNHRPVEKIRRQIRKSNLFLFAERYVREVFAWAATGHNPEGLGFLYYDDRTTPQVLRNAPEKTEDNLRQAAELVEARASQPILILEDTRTAHPKSWNAESFRRGRERVRRLAQNKAWPIIDIAALTREPWSLEREGYLLDFCHLNPRGHQIIAGLLVDVLVQTIPTQI